MCVPVDTRQHASTPRPFRSSPADVDLDPVAGREAVRTYCTRRLPRSLVPPQELSRRYWETYEQGNDFEAHIAVDIITLQPYGQHRVRSKGAELIFRRKLVYSAVVAALIGLPVGWTTSPATAGHVHTVDNVYHGCGECNYPQDFYIHPFTERNDTLWKSVYLNYRGGNISSSSCYCSHTHITWDTNPYAECRYDSQHGGVINLHTHYAHGYSSDC